MAPDLPAPTYHEAGEDHELPHHIAFDPLKLPHRLSYDHADNSDLEGLATVGSHLSRAESRRSSISSVLHQAAVIGHVELRGIAPIPVEERNVKRTVNVFTLWWCMNADILPITFGMLGPIYYGLDVLDCALVILFFTLVTTTIVAYCSTLGPKTGMRQMIQARYSFGRYPVSIPVLLNLATLTGFCVVMAVVGGLCLSAAAEAGTGQTASLTPTLGIVIMALLALVISFCGFSVLHVYERYAWIPSLLAIAVAAGCGGPGLIQQTPLAATPPVSAFMSFGMIVSSYMIPFACLASDFTTYIDPRVPSTRIFLYTYSGLTLPTILFMTLGAAMAGAVDSVPEWAAGYDSHLVGGVLAAMLAPAAGFGRFLVVLLAFSLLGNIAASSYSITLNFQMLLPWLVRVPRYLFAVVLTAIVIPVSIAASQHFFDNLENFVALIGYWSSAFLAVVLVEHFWFRGGDCDAYDPAIWTMGSRLPPGVAALAASALSFGLVVPCVAQVWYTGPIAKVTGDIGFEVAFLLSGLLYLPLRTLEKKVVGR